MQTAGYIVITVLYSHCYFTLFEVVEASVGLSALRSNSKGESKPQTDGQIAGRTDKRTDGRTDRTGIHILIATVSHSSSPLTRQPSVRTWSSWTELSWPTEFLRIIVIVNYCDIYSRILFFIFFFAGDSPPFNTHARTGQFGQLLLPAARAYLCLWPHLLARPRSERSADLAATRS